MSSIRVTGLGTTTREDELKVYFSKPENGGGPIQKIYSPLMNNDAVIIFQESHVAAQVMSIDEHTVSGREVELYILPPNIFSTVQARVDPAVSLLIESVASCKDHLLYIIGLTLTSDSTGCCILEGNMYQIEMAWEVIGRYLHQQERIHSRASNKGYNSHKNLSQLSLDGKSNRLEPSEHFLSSSGKQESLTPYWSKNGDRSEDNEDENEADSFFREKGKSKHKEISIKSQARDSKFRDRRNLPMEIDGETQVKSVISNVRPVTSPGAEWTQDLGSFSDDRVADLFSHSHKSSDWKPDKLFTESKKIPTSAESHLGSKYPDPVTKQSTLYRNETSKTADLPGYHNQRDRPEDILSLQSVNGRESIHAFPSNIGNSSDEDSAEGRTKRFDDANHTFENFSSLIHTNKQKGEASKSSKTTVKSSSAPNQVDMDSVKSSTRSSPERKSSSVIERLLSSHSLLEPQLESLRHSQRAALMSDLSQANSFTFYADLLKVTVCTGNITEMSTVAIVNAANGSLAHGAGVAGAIARAASPTMDRECEEYIRKYGLMSTGEIMHTRAGGRLPREVTHVLHAVGPIWLDNLPDRCMYELILTYVNIFKYANKLWIPSISLPCISSGVFGSPLDVSIKCFLDGALIFHSEVGDSSHLKEINLVNTDEDGVATSIAILQSLLDGGQDRATAEAIDRFTRLQEKRRDTNNKLRSASARSRIKDDMTTDIGRKTDQVRNETSRARRRSSSLSRLKARGEPAASDKKIQEESSSKKMSSSLQVSGSSSTLEKKSPRPSSSGRSSSQATYTKHTEESKSPRRPPTMKAALVTTSPPSGGAKPKTKTSQNVTTKNTPLKAGSGASTMEPCNIERELSKLKMNQTSNGAFKSYARDYNEEFHSLPVNLESSSIDKISFCKICHGKIRKSKTLYKCNHTFCVDCIEGQFRKHGPKCPQCGAMYSNSELNKTTSEEVESSPRSLLMSTVVHSSNPHGTMSHMTRRNMCVPGYEYCEGAIEIQYDIPSGKVLRNKDRSSSRSAYTGVQHKAYLPNSSEGREILCLLKEAFEADLVFRVSSRGTVEWCVSHKTSVHGSNGYPDSTYLRKIREELSRRGIR